MTAEEYILEQLAVLPDVPSYADVFDWLRPLYFREVAPIIAQYGDPPRPHGHWRRDITGSAETEEQKRACITRQELLSLMHRLPADAPVAEIIDEAMYQLVLSYSIDKACQNIADGMGLPRKEVKHRMSIVAG